MTKQIKKAGLRSRLEESEDEDQDQEFIPAPCRGVSLPQYLLLSVPERRRFFLNLNLRFQEQLMSIPSRPQVRRVSFSGLNQLLLFSQAEPASASRPSSGMIYGE